MSIQEKIDQIRNKPEHIRLRWAWMLAFFFTFCLIIIWAFSIKIKSKPKESTLTPEQKIFLDEFQTQKKSLEEVTKDLKNATSKTSLDNAPASTETEGFTR